MKTGEKIYLYFHIQKPLTISAYFEIGYKIIAQDFAMILYKNRIAKKVVRSSAHLGKWSTLPIFFHNSRFFGTTPILAALYDFIPPKQRIGLVN